MGDRGEKGHGRRGGRRSASAAAPDAYGDDRGDQGACRGASRERGGDHSCEEAEPGDEHYVENENELFCVCQQPYNVDTAMISCDSCSEWYHLRCVGLTQARALP